MGPVPLTRSEELVESGYEVVGYNAENLISQAEAGKKLGKSLKVHIKVETGTNRQGVSGEELKEILRVIGKYPSLILEGAYTHFANIEDTTDHSYAMRQLGLFHNAIKEIEADCGKLPVKHASCSAAGLLFPEAHFDIIRLGISLYGMWPSKETYLSYMLKYGNKGEDLLRPVMTWKTRVCQIKRVPKDSFIGYGLTYKVTHDTTIAVLPVGYYDGIDRGQSNIASVLIKGRRAQIRGRVCMDFIMVDITDIPGVELGEEVVLLGKQGDEEVSADHLASHIGTINYEVVTRIAQDVPRIVV
jgi:alanine racemase